MDRGWIKTHRKLKDNIFLMRDNNAYIVFTKLLLFVDANGQWAGGKHQLADHMNIPAGTLYEVLRRLETNGMITIAPNHKYSVYKICKWSQYQKNTANTLQFDVKTTRQPRNVPNRQKPNHGIPENGKNPTTHPTAPQQIEIEQDPTTNPTVTQPRANRDPTVSQHSYKNKKENKNKENTTNVVLAKAPNVDITSMFEYWEQTTGIPISSRQQQNRYACSNLIKKHGIDGLERLISGVAQAQSDQYAPRIADFAQLQSKLGELLVWGKKKMVIPTKGGVYKV